MIDPLRCERCGCELESDDAISIIEGTCERCRSSRSRAPARASLHAERTAATVDARKPRAASEQTEPEPDPAEAFGRLWHAASGIPAEPPKAVETPVEIERPRHVGPVSNRSRTQVRCVRPARRHRRRRDLAIGTVAGLMLCAGVGWHFVSQGSQTGAVPVTEALLPPPAHLPMTLTVDPPTATVLLDGEQVGQPDARGKLTLEWPAGDQKTHWLEVSATGYHTVRRPLSVFSGVGEVAIELVRQPYQVAIRTDPPNAEVWIDNELRGFSPLETTVLPTHAASLVLRLAGYVDQTRTLTPPEDGGGLQVEAALQAAGLVVRVESDPPQARITMDGSPVGTAPLLIELDPGHLGREVVLRASLEGYEEAVTRLTLPEIGGTELPVTRLALDRAKPRIEFVTEPVAGQIILDGRAAGQSPVEVAFDPADAGRTLVVEGVVAGSHYGRQELVVPRSGETLHVTVPMAFNVRRVVFVLWCPPGRHSDFVVLSDQLVEAVHRLQTPQRFAMLAATDDGIETWPGGLGTEAASSEQKVRAYDTIRLLRPGGGGEVGTILRAALAFQPNTIWLFAGRRLDREDMQAFSDWAAGHDVSVNVVRSSLETDEAWLEEWAALHRGTLAVLGLSSPPALALQDEGAE